MKILWVKSDFLHPTTRGGQIRTLEMLRCLHRRHEIHYVAFEDASQPEGVGRSSEYSSRAYPIRHNVPSRRSLKFIGQLVGGLWSELPVSILRYRSSEMRHRIAQLIAEADYDRIVCDFLTPAVNIDDLSRVILFQHNVETMIWQRHAAINQNPIAKYYLRLQARRMARFERRICRAVAHIVAVSAPDAARMRELFGVTGVSEIPTGVDVKFFAPREPAIPAADLVFVGSMDWLPNVDGVRFFVNDVLPLIRRFLPECSVAIVGRKPGPDILAVGRTDSRILITGSVADVRSYLWGAKVAIVPIRIGGGTRLKIYEAMAARVPVVSTTIGAEGLGVTPSHLRIADGAADFATACIELLTDPAGRRRLASAAWELVSSSFSWETIAARFETVLADVSKDRNSVLPQVLSKCGARD